MLLNLVQRSTLPASGYCVTVLLVLFAAPCASSDKTGRISGVIFTLGPDRVQVVWPTESVTLKNLATRSEIAVSSDQLGVYTFFDAIPGDYEIEINLAGFETQKKSLKVEAGHPARVDFQFVLKKRTETVQVTSETQGVDLTPALGGTPILTAGILKSVVQLSADFQQVLPLLPNYFNPRDVQEYAKSPNYGHFYNSIGRLWRIEGAFDF
ncbi:MAG: carboxypeptidase-like regulatory domain-containing protein [Terriglobales bacterium]